MDNYYCKYRLMIVLYHFKLVKYEKFGQFMVFLGLSQFIPVFTSLSQDLFTSLSQVYPRRFIPWDKPPLLSLSVEVGASQRHLIQGVRGF